MEGDEELGSVLGGGGRGQQEDGETGRDEQNPITRKNKGSGSGGSGM